jgi:hypothetical protein
MEGTPISGSAAAGGLGYNVVFELAFDLALGLGIGIGHRYRSSVIGHRSSVIGLNPHVSLGCASFGLRQPERHRYRSSESMAETMDAASSESGVIRIEWAQSPVPAVPGPQSPAPRFTSCP